MTQPAQPGRPTPAPIAGRAMDAARSGTFIRATIPAGYSKYLLRQVFEPWAAQTLRRVTLGQGDSVLDVASGLGPVARLAAAAVGQHGRVVASDISPAMLAVAASRPTEPHWAPIEYLECPAAAIDAADDSFDVVFCQHGLQFFADREAALAEIYRVARPGAVAVISAWAAERPVGLFSQIGQALQEVGLSAPYPQAFDPDSYRVGGPELRGLLEAVGFGDVTVDMVELDNHWQSADDAANTVRGTPFGPILATMSADDRQRFRKILLGKLGGSTDGVAVRTTSNIATGTKPIRG
jgi:SAM-dependent methyltransferase